jgi:hypothetical protein
MQHFLPCSTLILALVTGCYDGWETGRDYSTPNLPTGSEPPIFQLDLININLGSGALATPACFGATGTETFREAEWAERQSAIKEAIEKLSVGFSASQITIAASDCTTLQAVEDKSFDTSSSVADDPLDRPIVQFIAVFWDGDVPGTMPASVTRRDWSAQQKLKDRGRKILTLNYFSLSNKSVGKFSQWQTTRGGPEGNANGVLGATPINAIDPTSAGQQARRAIAISDASAAAAWLSGEVAKL